MKNPEDRFEKPPKSTQKSERATDASARAHLKMHLGWLTGFPLARGEGSVTWITMPPPGAHARVETILIGPEQLRATEYGRNAARRKFPKALPRVVGDVAAWTQRTDAQLSTLKRMVHDDAKPPRAPELMAAAGFRRSTQQRISALLREAPDLDPVISSLVWLHWHDEEQLLAALDQLNPAATRRLLRWPEQPKGLLTALHLVQLQLDGLSGILAGWLGEALAWQVPVRTGTAPWQLVNALVDLERTTHLGANHREFLQDGIKRPAVMLADQLVAFILDLGNREPRQARRAMQLCELFAPMAQVPDWQTWWSNIAMLEREARKLLAIWDPENQKLRSTQGHLLRRARDSHTHPTEIDLEHFVALADLFEAASDSAFDDFKRCLELLMRDETAREEGRVRAARFLARFETSLAYARPSRARVQHVLAALREMLEATVGEARWWYNLVAEKLLRDVCETWFESKTPQTLIKPALDVFSRLTHELHGHNAILALLDTYLGWHLVLSAVKDCKDAARVANAVLAVIPQEERLHGELWSAAARLADYDPQRFRALAAELLKQDWRTELASELLRIASDGTVAPILERAIAAGEGHRAERIVALSRLARALGVHTVIKPIANESVISFAAYPSEWQALLGELADWDRRAATAIPEILGKDFPLAADRHREIEHLREIAAEADAQRRHSIERRIANIEARLGMPKTVAPSRLANLETKLQRRLAMAQLETWETALRDALAAGLTREIGRSPPAEWLERGEVLDVLTNIGGLTPKFRALAFRLLARVGQDPSDLREDAANQRFVRQMTEAGINMAPWLEGLAPLGLATPDRTLTLALEHNPLEIMRMGAPFETCLAPGNFNYFSVMTNAADVNKCVLYARDDHGTIHGRCLLALSDDGHIITFHVYAHAHGAIVSEGVRDYVRALATAMGTSAAPQGTIRTLVATDWYDDGPSDLTGQLAFLDEDTQFMRTVPELAPGEIVAKLKAELGGAPISPWVVYTMARNRAFAERPELIVPLMPYLGHFSRLDRWTRLALAPVLREAGDRKTALALLEPFRRGRARTEANTAYDYATPASELIALGFPHEALQLLRSGPVTERDHWDRQDSDATFVAARALWALKRPRQALDVAQIAQKAGSTDAQALIDEIKRAGY